VGDLEFRHLRYFLAVAEELNFTRAARHLHVSQPALSQQIRAAEKIIGGRLFDRGPGGVRLTAAGEALVQPAGNALELVAEGLRVARAKAQADRPEVIRIGVPWAETLGELTQPILSAYAEAYPHIRLVYSSMDPGELYNGLPDQTVDVVLARLPLDPEQCEWTELFEDHHVAVVGVGSPLFDAESVRISDIIDLAMPDVVLRSPAPDFSSHWTLVRERGERPQLVGESISSAIELSYTLLHNPKLVCLAPETAQRLPLFPAQFLRFVKITDWEKSRAVVARRRGDRRPDVLRFFEVAQAVTRQLGPVLLPPGTVLAASPHASTTA
jgi:DNA-binding transcriptional LysR family regulator